MALARDSIFLQLDENKMQSVGWNISEVIVPKLDGVLPNELMMFAPEGSWSINEPIDAEFDITESGKRIRLRTAEEKSNILDDAITSRIELLGNRKQIEISAGSYTPVPLNVPIQDILVGAEGLYPGRRLINLNQITHTNLWYVGNNVVVFKSVYDVETQDGMMPGMQGPTDTTALLIGFNISTEEVLFVHQIDKLLLTHFSIGINYDEWLVGKHGKYRNHSVMIGSNIFAFVINFVADNESFLVRLDCATGQMSSTLIPTGITGSRVLITGDSTLIPNTVIIFFSKDDTNMSTWGMSATLSDTDAAAEPVFSPVVQIFDETAALGSASFTPSANSFSTSIHLRKREDDEMLDVYLFSPNVVIHWVYNDINDPVVSPRFRGWSTFSFPLRPSSAELIGDHILIAQVVQHSLATDHIPLSDIDSDLGTYGPTYTPGGDVSINQILNSFMHENPLVNDSVNVVQYKILNGDLYIQLSVYNSGDALNGRLAFIRLSKASSEIDSDWVLAHVFYSRQARIDSDGAPNNADNDFRSIQLIDNSENAIITDGLNNLYIISSTRVGGVFFPLGVAEDETEVEDAEDVENEIQDKGKRSDGGISKHNQDSTSDSYTNAELYTASACVAIGIAAATIVSFFTT